MKALYVAASGMAAQQTRIDNVANNIANVGTTGFKKSRESFQDLLYEELTQGGKASSQARLEVGGGVQLAGIEKDHRQGSLTQTGQPLHAAIAGDAFFTLETAEGEPVYTRDGTFRLDADGTLVTQSGLVVGGNITIPEDAQQVFITGDGTVQAVLQGSVDYTVLGQLELASFTNPAGLRALGGNLYEQTPESGEVFVPRPESVEVKQGYLESSNVDVAEELIQMIMAQRSYELNSKVVQAADEAMSVAVNLKR
ncbi:MAG: flagellar basal-body rod protein FlgG [Deltaproteobacteria bacterium]|nr:flagellar basal-body rod protein FlgG [Deltaproteobacteria bacterium]